MRIFGRIGEHHTIAQAIALKMKNVRISNKTRNKISAKLERVESDYAKEFVNPSDRPLFFVKCRMVKVGAANLEAKQAHYENIVAHLEQIKSAIIGGRDGYAATTLREMLDEKIEDIWKKSDAADANRTHRGVGPINYSLSREKRDVDLSSGEYKSFKDECMY
ncbi:hypothetical protein [Burkholderia contaminans]|uniref:hypothetical protein n=1 Tax=Burkholderia contaminans TaxID=488447 RepID=UPI001581AD7A|nr:hypothetical protein [Burkholderia contaminans]